MAYFFYLYLNYETFYDSLGIKPVGPNPLFPEQDLLDFIEKFIPDYEELLDDEEVKKKILSYIKKKREEE